jgi:hypothetical protein
MAEKYGNNSNNQYTSLAAGMNQPLPQNTPLPSSFDAQGNFIMPKVSNISNDSIGSFNNSQGPGANMGTSLAGGQLQNPVSNPDMSFMTDPLGNNSLANNNSFFDPNNSMMDNAGQAVGLAGGVASLASILDNWGVGKKAMNLNMDNMRQQMSQNKTAFDRSVARQDGTSLAIANANEAARNVKQEGYS